MRPAICLAAAAAGLFGLVAVVVGGLCCPPAGFVAHLVPTAAMAAALDPGGPAGRVGGDR